MTEPHRNSENTENISHHDPAASTAPTDNHPNDFQLEPVPVFEDEPVAEELFSPTESTPLTEPGIVGNGSDSFRIQRIQKREPSFLRKVLPPVLGGLAAFPIATAIMWYGLGKDIGSTGQYVGKYAPWIVPSKLRGGSFGSDGKFGGGSGSIAKNQPNRAAREATAIEQRPLQEQKPLPTEAPPSEAPPSLNTSPNNSIAEPEAPTTNRALPKLERSKSNEKVDTRDFAGPSIRTTLQQIAELQLDWNNTPNDREKKLEKLSAFYAACVQLASQTGELRGNALRAWQKDLDQFSTSILSSPTFTKAIELCSQGGIPSIPAPSLGDSVILIEKLTIDKEIAGNQEFPSRLIADDKPLNLILPEPLIKQLKTPSEPRQRILLGRIVDSESNSVILVHCCLE